MDSIGPSSVTKGASSVSGAADDQKRSQQAELLAAAGAAAGIACITPPTADASGSLQSRPSSSARHDEPSGRHQQRKRGGGSGQSAAGKRGRDQGTSGNSSVVGVARSPASDTGGSSSSERGVYSFCMCPGGQVGCCTSGAQGKGSRPSTSAENTA